MKTLIIYAHPDTGGHCATFLKEIKDQLRQNGEIFDVIDLYKINYDPVLKKEELYTAGNHKITGRTKQFQDKIKKADKLIFIYPIWWGSTPAALKGFFDRVLIPGFAFKFSKGSSTPNRLLKGKKAVVFITSGSSPFYYWLLLQAPTISIKYFTLAFCGIKSKVYQIYNARRINKNKKDKIKKLTQKGLNWLYK